jgi:uncharacterized protein YndB with AHSA1/START domain
LDKKQGYMAKDQIELTTEIPASPVMVYQHWLSTEGHTLMTGGMAQIGPQENTEFMAWDGYISGEILELEPNRRIYQSWRTSDFAPTDKSSKLEIILAPTEDKKGTILTLKHWDLPEGEGDKYAKGWEENYFKPMKEYFLSP